MEITENLLEELNETLRVTIDKNIHDTFSKPYDKMLFPANLYYMISIRLRDARLNFKLWPLIENDEKIKVFEFIRDIFQKKYGLQLVNQRFYNHEIKMDFGKEEDLIDPFELYTLIKIN